MERCVAGFFVDPLNALRREYRETRRRTCGQNVKTGNPSSGHVGCNLPIYRVSPQLLVTSEHIISDNASTSVSDSFCESGEVAAVCGLDWESMRGVVLCEVTDCCWVALGMLNLFAFRAALREFVRSASLFSNVPKSVFPLSSSERRPDSRRSDSMRPRRFSKPSMYFALHCPVRSNQARKSV